MKEERYRPRGRIYLYPDAAPGERSPFTQGTFWDLEAEGMKPVPGMRLSFYDHDATEKRALDCLLFTGVIGQDENGVWYAVIDEGSFCHESDLPADTSN